MSIIVALPPRNRVTVNSTGAGNRNNGNNNYTLTTTFTHTVVGGSNRRMYAFVAVGHSNWLNSYSTNPSASSSIDGAFTIVSGPLFFGDASGNRQGSVTLLELINPSVGTHTITMSCSASQWLSTVGGNTRCYNNVSGRGAAVTQAQTTTNAALNLAVTAAAGDMALIVTAFSGAPTFTGGQPTPWYSVGSSLPGDADYLVGLDLQSSGGSYTFSTTSSAHKIGAIGINLTKA